MGLVLAAVGEGEALAVEGQSVAGIGCILYSGDGDVAFVSGGGGDGTEVGVVRADKANGGELGHAVLVTCGNAHYDAGFFHTLVDVTEGSGFQTAVIGEAVLCTDGHIDHINAQIVGILQGGEVNVGGGAAAFILEDLHGNKLCSRCTAGHDDRTVGALGIANCSAGNMGAVTVGVSNIVVLVCIVICEGNLSIDVLCRNGSLGQRGGSQNLSQGHILVDLESLVGNTQAGIQNCNDDALTVVTTLVHGSIADDLVGVGVLRILYTGGLIVVCNVNRGNALDLCDLFQVAVSHITAEAVEQGAEFVHGLIADGAHGITNSSLFLVQTQTVSRTLGSSALKICFGSAFKEDDGTNNIAVSVCMQVVLPEFLTQETLSQCGGGGALYFLSFFIVR